MSRCAARTRSPDAEGARILLDLAPGAGTEAEARELAQRLGGLPLALHLAGTHLGSEFSDIAGFAAYRAALGRPGAAAALLAADPDTAPGADHRTVVMRTWEISLNDLAGVGLAGARPILRLLACYAAATPIPLWLLTAHRLEAVLDRGEPPDRILRALARVGLIDRQPTVDQASDVGIIVHPIVAVSNLSHLDREPAGAGPTPADIRRAAVDLVADAVTRLRHDRPADWPSFKLLTPHLHALFDNTVTHLADDDLPALLHAAATTADAQGWSGSARASEDLSRAGLTCADRLGQEHPAILMAWFNLAWAIGSQGRLTEAESLYRRVLDARRRVLGDGYPDTIAARRMLGWAIAEQHRWADAEAVYQRLLNEQADTLGPDDPATLITRDSLAFVTAQQGRWAAAEHAYRQVSALRRRILGSGHPSTLLAREACFGSCGPAEASEMTLRHRRRSGPAGQARSAAVMPAGWPGGHCTSSIR